MFPVKSEPSDTFDVGKDSQRIISMDDNQNISDTLNTNTSDNQSDKSINDEMFLTVAYVKNERTSHASDYNASYCKRNECIHGQQVTDINVIKSEKTDVCTDITSGDVTDDEPTTIHVEEESEHYNIKGNDISHMTGIWQYYRVGESNTIDMEDSCPPSLAKSRDETYKGIKNAEHSAEMRFKCDVCAYSTGRYFDLKKHNRVHSREKPFKCSLCDYGATQSGDLKRHKLIHTGDKPCKCD